MSTVDKVLSTGKPHGSFHRRLGRIMSTLPTDEDDGARLDRQVEARLQEIAAETQQQALTSEPRPLTYLQEQYADSNSSNFISGVTALQTDYSHMRTIRGDGNYYYCAFLYNLVEQFMCNSSESQRIWECLTTQSW